MTSLSIVSLDSLLTTELLTREQGTFLPQWSFDGQYLAYSIHSPTPSDTPPETYIQIVHMDSGTVSEIHLEGLSGLDWSPDGPRVLIDAWVPPEDGYGFDEYTVYTGDILCDETTHQCHLSDIVEVPNVGRYPAWMPGTQQIVSVVNRYSDEGSEQVLLITNTEGIVIQEFTDPYTAAASWPQGSIDGRYVGFRASGGELIILDLDDLSLHALTDLADSNFEVLYFQWLD
jgi:hypothetical protein